MYYFCIIWFVFSSISLILRELTLRKEFEYLMKMKTEILSSDENPLEGTLSKEEYINLINTQINNVQESLRTNPIQDLILSFINWPKELLHCYDRYLVFRD